MHTKLKNKLTAILIILSFFIMAAVSVSAIFALTQQNVETEVDFDYQAQITDGVLIYSKNEDGQSYSITSYNNDGIVSANGNVVIPETYNNLPVTKIAEGAFANASITSVVMPDCVTSIGDSAFNGCSQLTSVYIGYGVVYIGVDAFVGCSSLSSVEFGNDSYIGWVVYASNGSSITFTAWPETSAIIYCLQTAGCYWQKEA